MQENCFYKNERKSAQGIVSNILVIAYRIFHIKSTKD